MNEAMVYLSAIGLAIFIFPVHFYNYIYIDTEKKYASLNLGVYKFNFFNINTVENHPGQMQINGSDKKIDFKSFKPDWYKIIDSLCLYKIVQLGDYGALKEKNIYIAFAQYMATTVLYKLIQINGNYGKLRNYTVINAEHEYVRYYAKVVTVINLAVVSKIIFFVIMGKINGIKKKKKQEI